MRDLFLGVLLLSAFPLILYRYQIGALVIGFMSFMYPQSNAYGFVLTVPWIDYFFMVTIASYVIAQGYKQYKHHHLITYLLIFYSWLSITTVFAIDTDISYDPWLKFTKVLILAIVVFAMLNTEKRLITCMKVMVLSIGFYGIKGGIFTIISGGSYRVLGPINSFFADNNGMALILVMTLPFMLFFITHADNIYQKYFSIFCSLCSAIAVLGTQSRTGFIALIISFLYFTWLQKKLGKALLFIIPLTFVAYFVMADSWSERMASSAQFETDSSFQGRVDMWNASIRIVNDYPILGGGFDVIYVPEVIKKYIPYNVGSRAIHSAYFQSLAEHGYVGFGLFIVMLFLSFQAARKLARESKYNPKLAWFNDLSIAVRSSLVGYMVLALTANIAFFDMLYFHIVILAIASILIKKEREANRLSILETPS